MQVDLSTTCLVVLHKAGFGPGPTRARSQLKQAFGQKLAEEPILSVHKNNEAGTIVDVSRQRTRVVRPIDVVML